MRAPKGNSKEKPRTTPSHLRIVAHMRPRPTRRARAAPDGTAQKVGPAPRFTPFGLQSGVTLPRKGSRQRRGAWTLRAPPYVALSADTGAATESPTHGAVVTCAGGRARGTTCWG